jgi:hypothetical protein
MACNDAHTSSVRETIHQYFQAYFEIVYARFRSASSIVVNKNGTHAFVFAISPVSDT